jgi:hypothetical protein
LNLLYSFLSGLIHQEDRLGAVYSWGLVAADGRLGYVDDEAMTGAADVMLICG